MDMNHIPDAAMTIATTALFAKGTTTLRNIYNWRSGKKPIACSRWRPSYVKWALKSKKGHDYIRITPPAKLQHADNWHVQRPPYGDVASHWSHCPIRQLRSWTLNVPQKRSLIISNNWARMEYARLILLLRQSTGWRVESVFALFL
ncbi:3-phosphoshikimate 1-carboxyvinyltransferase [Salmonella enterica subsp. enterica]|nr:3-phosphoshikimate 1-carboxyvinyltransferase [Salmonella enterica subsp. enterica] [Salmonella enterica subsp. enterica serovar Menston]